jgi:hypothetical protein
MKQFSRYWCFGFFWDTSLSLLLVFARPGDRFVYFSKHLLIIIFICVRLHGCFMPDQFQPRLLHIKVDSYPGVPLLKLKPVNLLACMTGMIYASCRKPSPTFLERQFTWLSDFPIRHHIFLGFSRLSAYYLHSHVSGS